MSRLTSLLGNSQKLDGGAMFGHVPKALWQRWLKPDEANRISLACRALLIEDGNKKILLETGIGAFFNPNLRERYGVFENEHVLVASLKKVKLTPNDIDFVILSHLHFDHAGGLLTAWQENETPSLLFQKAQFLVSKAGWERAKHPHLRDRASFIPGLTDLLEASNRLVILDKESTPLLGENYRFHFTNGHTPGLMHTIYKAPAKDPIVFASDLIPGTPWLHLPVCMGYDRAPECLVDEKKALLDYCLKENAYLFYTHDVKHAMSRVKEEEGKFLPKDEVGDELMAIFT